MSRQSQDLYTSVQTAHNKIDKLDKRISKLEGGIVASADALADLEYRHLKRIEALECCEGCVDWPCETSQILKGDAPGWTPTCYRFAPPAGAWRTPAGMAEFSKYEKKTCRQCRYLGEEHSPNAFECWRRTGGRFVWYMCKESVTCPNFEAIQ